MKFSFFEALTDREANEYLNEFLQFGKYRGVEMLQKNLNLNGGLDFSLESMPEILKDLIPKLKTIPRDADSSVPDFIRNPESYRRNLFDFEESSISISILMAAAYYLGESFVQSFENLSWSKGRARRAEVNQPVISGFSLDKDMPVILITENLFRGAISGIREVRSIDKTIEVWKGYA